MSGSSIVLADQTDLTLDWAQLQWTLTQPHGEEWTQTSFHTVGWVQLGWSQIPFHTLDWVPALSPHQLDNNDHEYRNSLQLTVQFIDNYTVHVHWIFVQYRINNFQVHHRIYN